MVRPAPAIAALPTLVIRPQIPLFESSAQAARYEQALGDQLTMVTVPNGHHGLWEAPEETISAIADFVGAVA
jgi:pimeloyl-ACP methyl ester carboxylesterase